MASYSIIIKNGTIFDFDGSGGPSKDVVQGGTTTIDNIQEFELNYSLTNFSQANLYRKVAIDIKPGSYPNSINLKSKGVTPVAILSDKFFNAKDIIIDTILFAGAKPVKSSFEDVNKDGYQDLILHFDTQSLQLKASDTAAILTGKLKDGAFIKGGDSVKIIQVTEKQSVFSKISDFFAGIFYSLSNLSK